MRTIINAKEQKDRDDSTVLQPAKTIVIGFALFAMFFGAGNMVFPLFLGANAGAHIFIVAIIFIIIGVGTPLLGLISTAMFHGNYWDFFGRLGKLPAYLIITFIILIIGPLSAAPRTEVITYQSLLPFLPKTFTSPIIFSLIFCFITFLCAYRENKIVDIIGYKITPIKLSCFVFLILAAIFSSANTLKLTPSFSTIAYQAVSMGYGTMDLLGAFFFSTIAVRAITSHNAELTMQRQALIRANIIAGVLLGLIYLGFMFAAYFHAASLQNLSPDQLIHNIAGIVLGKFGAFFVGICVTFACLATSIALADVTSTYLYDIVVLQTLSRLTCMLIVLVIMFFMTQLGFSGIMSFAYPLLKILYPALITLCLVNVLYKCYGFKYVKLPVMVTAIIATIVSFIY